MLVRMYDLFTFCLCQLRLTLPHFIGHTQPHKHLMFHTAEWILHLLLLLETQKGGRPRAEHAAQHDCLLLGLGLILACQQRWHQEAAAAAGTGATA